MNVIETHGFTKVYSGRRVVDALDMHVARGDIYGFVGRNGAGKSTTMKMICGLIDPSEGSLDVLGTQDGAAPRGKRFVGSLIESPGLLEKLSGMDNLMIKAYALGVENPREHCEELLEFVGLTSAAGAKAGGYSLGMRQRLGIALALVGDPELLLLDESFNGLDPEATRTMRETLAKLNREKGVTIVVSSHVLDQLNRFANRFGVISDGHMVREFDGSELRHAGQAMVRVRTADMASAESLLGEKLENVEIKTQNGALLIVGDGAQIEPISQMLFEAGQRVIELTPLEHDIEDIFLDMMRSKNQAPDTQAPTVEAQMPDAQAPTVAAQVPDAQAPTVAAQTPDSAPTQTPEERR